MQELFKKFSSKKENHIKNLISLHDEGNTVPFIARYRKEQTGGMDENEIREIIEEYQYLLNLKSRKDEVLKRIEEKGKLTDKLKNSIIKAATLKEVDDLYAPYKSKRKTKADIARDYGLQPLAEFVKYSDYDNAIYAEGEKYSEKNNINSADEALKMACDIISEEVGHDLEVKNRLREIYSLEGVLESVLKEKKTGHYEDYYDFKSLVKDLPEHRILAIFRGESQKELKVKISADEETLYNSIASILLKNGVELNSFVIKAIRSAMKRMLEPSIELEIRNELKEKAEKQAIKVFAENLKNLLLTPPVKNRRILGIDPAFRTGCKFAAVDERGRLLDYGVIYPTEPQSDYVNSKNTLLDVINEHHINIVTIGNGTGSRQTEEFVDKVIQEENLDITYTIISEAGASVYSASSEAAIEFPDLDVTIRGAVSIARRVLDPLAEFVKIDPKSIGVGMYQHDVNQKLLQKTLDEVVEDVVNNVGVDLNTASPSLLKYVAGLNRSIADKIYKLRQEKNKFSSRKDLLKVAGIGEDIFRQCAGFLKIYNGDEPLDKMFIHPESYDFVYSLLSRLNVNVKNANMLSLALKNKNISEIKNKFDVGELTFQDIVDNLQKPDLDIRDNVDPLVFKKGILKIEDLKPGMQLTGKISNVVDFGAFVDIGLKNDGLVHISQIAEKFIKHPSEIVSVGQTVSAKVIDVDKQRGRISLSLR
ncbi:MAG: RNA-binding transcriptional accessory protein [Flexistipes sinusarabici]|uniref:RNA-binding transcriptional accessory protein n=1 Tax=Flexistipes sinusarabici TaxID=2352 RepID=A0A5D0MSA1_FLESI|nr:Tex family protein [Flexistipes sinusarabici]TYB34891.1 MAG: RNA-binding transcriptional accessory protein [Flexistipes sinusarabici]